MIDHLHHLVYPEGVRVAILNVIHISSETILQQILMPQENINILYIIYKYTHIGFTPPPQVQKNTFFVVANSPKKNIHTVTFHKAFNFIKLALNVFADFAM